VPTGAVSAQYAQFDFLDQNNAKGYIEIGRLLVGRAFRPADNYEYGNNELGFIPLGSVRESFGGRRSYTDSGVRRKWKASFPLMTETEAFSEVMRMGLRTRTSRQVFVVPDPNDLLYKGRRSFLATFVTTPAIQQVAFPRVSTSFEFEEVL
jgi:hypothetical protein